MNILRDSNTVVSDLNPWWDDTGFRNEVITRARYRRLGFDNRYIEVLIGARRVGKTSILKSIINDLLDDGVNPKQIVYFVADIRGAYSSMPEDIVSTVRDLHGISSDSKIYCFFDEVQDMHDWQRSVKFLYDNYNVKIYLSGSSSLVLKPQTSKLTGRFILHEVLGLTFEEFLIFSKKKILKDKKRNLELVNEYLQVGGYPEYVLNRNQDALINIVESTLYRDLLSHYGLRNPVFLKDLLDYLSDKVTSQVGYSNIAKDLKVDDETAKFYLQYLQDVYLVYPVYKKGASHRIVNNSLPKYYFNDTGILNIRSLNPKIGALAENSVYLQLRRGSMSKEYPDIYYNEIDGVEVDFQDREGQLYEVKYRDSVEVDDLNKYQLVSSKITFITKEYSKIYNDMLPMHDKISLQEFLLIKGDKKFPLPYEDE